MNDGIRVKGSFRLNITEDGKVVGDSGWYENVVTNDGFLGYLVKLIGGISGSSQIGYAALGTGGAPATNATTLTGELASRAAVTAASSSSSKAVQFTATFSSSDSFVAGTSNISNIGLFATNTSGTLFSGNTYASSSCATNQDVNVTYVLSFS